MTPVELRARGAAYQRAYAERHPDRIRTANHASAALSRPWERIGGRAARFAYFANRSAARFGSTERLCATDVRILDGACVYCAGAAGGWDHVIPLSRGGRNHVSNLARCCASCNKAKGVRTPEEWRLGVVVDRRCMSKVS